jgi:hypothetical protein
MNKIGHYPAYILRRMLSNMKHWICALILFAMWPLAAQADVWGYIDVNGVAHFAAEKLDERYELFFKGNTGFDTKDGLNASSGSPSAKSIEPETPRSVGLLAGKSKLIAFFEVSPNFKAVRHHMRESAQAYNIDFELLQALIATESGFDTQAVSPKGAVGLMQLMPPTAQRYGVKGDANTPIEKKLTDPKTNIKAGSRYLRDLINLFPGRLDLALAAYNAGEGAVQRYGNKIPPFKETQNYVVTVMQIYRQLKPPALTAKPAPAAASQQPNRVRMEFGGQAGQIQGRGNMVPPLSGAPTPAPEASK